MENEETVQAQMKYFFRNVLYVKRDMKQRRKYKELSMNELFFPAFLVLIQSVLFDRSFLS